MLLAGVPAPVQAQLGMPERFVRLTESTRRLAVTVAATHHERLDGSGYPHGLVGDEITLAARIVAVADVYDALRSNRCYRQSLSVAETLGIVRKDAQAGRLDGRVVEELERRVERIERDLASVRAQQLPRPSWRRRPSPWLRGSEQTSSSPSPRSSSRR